MMGDFIEMFHPVVATVTRILIHSLWQGGIIALLLAAALMVLKKSDARLRYALCCLALVSMVAWCALTGVYYVINSDLSAVARPDQSLLAEQAIGPTLSQSGAAVSSSAVTDLYRVGGISLYSWMFPAWVLGVVLLSVYHVIGWRRMSRTVRRGTDRIPDAWKKRFACLCDELRVMRPVSLIGSSRVVVPCVFGWIRPVVLMPVSIFSGLGASEIEMIIVHELAHVRRNDILVNILQTAAETLLFFNPAVWWISRQIRVERENCCDDVVVACRHDRLGYARALASLEEWRAVSGGFVAAAAGASLLSRVRRIVGSTAGRTRPASLGVAGVLLMAVLLGIGLVVFGGPAQKAVAETVVETAESFEKQSGDVRGSWELETEGSRAQVRMRFGRRMNVGFTIRLSELTGKIDENMTYLRIVRDAGTFHLVGKFEDDDGEFWGDGDCYFRVNPEYIKEMERLGFDLGDEDDVFTLAIHDVTLAYARGLVEFGYDNLSVGKLIEAHIHDVTPEFVKEFIELGYKDLKMDRLIEMSIHDANPDFVRGLAQHGYHNLPAGRLVEMRIHDADPEFVGGLAEAGYANLDPSRLVEMRIHDVTPDYVRRLGELGYKDIEPSRLVEMRIHDVSPQYIRELAELGYKDVSPSRLVEMRIHDVTPRFIRKLKDRGYDDLSPRELIDIKIHGDY